MKKKISVLVMIVFVISVVSGCMFDDRQSTSEMVQELTEITQIETTSEAITESFAENTTEDATESLAEATTEATTEEMTTQEQVTLDSYSEGQIVAAVEKYCRSQNPDLNNLDGEYDFYWTMDQVTDEEYKVLFRSYTAAMTYYHINKLTGNVTTTVVVPAISLDEMDDPETFNIYDYIE